MTTVEAKKLEVRFAELSGVDINVAMALAQETIAEAEMVFGQTADRRIVRRAALEALIDLLSRPARVLDFLPNVAMQRVRESIAVG